MSAAPETPTLDDASPCPADCYTCGLLGFEDAEGEHEHTFDDLVRAEFAERSARPRRSRAMWQLVNRAKAAAHAANDARQTAELTIEITAKIGGRETWQATLTPSDLPTMERLVARLAAAAEPETTYVSVDDALRALYPEDTALEGEGAVRLLRDLAQSAPDARLNLVLRDLARREKVEAAKLAVGGLVPIDDQGRAVTTALDELDARERARALAETTRQLLLDHPALEPTVEAPTLGAVVREQRLDAGLSLRELARLCGLEVVALGNLERGVVMPGAVVLSTVFHRIGEAKVKPHLHIGGDLGGGPDRTVVVRVEGGQIVASEEVPRG